MKQAIKLFKIPLFFILFLGRSHFLSAHENFSPKGWCEAYKILEVTQHRTDSNSNTLRKNTFTAMGGASVLSLMGGFLLMKITGVLNQRFLEPYLTKKLEEKTKMKLHEIPLHTLTFESLILTSSPKVSMKIIEGMAFSLGAYLGSWGGFCLYPLIYSFLFPSSTS